MDRFDEVFSVLTEDQGWSEENARKIMVYCVEQGMNPIEAGARFVAGMAGLPSIDMRKNFFNPWNMFPKKPEPQKGLPKPESSRLPTRLLPPAKPIPTPNQTQGMLGSRSVPNIQQVSSKYGLDTPAPKPQFGPGSTKPIGPNPARNIFNLPPADAGIKARNALNSTLKATLKATPKNLFSRLTNNRYVKAATAAVPFVLGADALIRGDQSVIGRQGRSGPELTPEIVKGVQQREKLAQQRAETQAASKPAPKATGERSASANVAKQETAKANIERRRVASASFDKEFAAARAAGEKEFTWRGKRYNTRLK